MMRLASVASVFGFALLGIGCQPPLPPQSAQQGATAAPHCVCGPEMMARHHEGEAHDMPEAHHDSDDHERGPGRMGRGGNDRHRRGNEKEGMRGGQEAMRELAALGVHFYPPPMLIHQAQKIGLTPDQVTKIRQEILGDKAHAVDLVAKIEHAKVEAARLLSADKVDEHAVGAQIDEATKAEAEMHKLHLGTMLRVRALLTPEQRQKLDEHKREHDGPKPGMGAPGKTAMGEADDDDDDDDDDDGDDADG